MTTLTNLNTHTGTNNVRVYFDCKVSVAATFFGYGNGRALEFAMSNGRSVTYWYDSSMTAAVKKVYAADNDGAYWEGKVYTNTYGWTLLVSGQDVTTKMVDAATSWKNN